VDDIACIVNIPNKGSLHDVFHVSCLKKTPGSEIVAQRELPLTRQVDART
jgi:hypothetical protein